MAVLAASVESAAVWADAETLATILLAEVACALSRDAIPSKNADGPKWGPAFPIMSETCSTED